MSDNPLLQKLKLPGRVFQLPSRGMFYNNGELDESVKDGEIHVHPMSALAEINMKNPDQLFSGQAVEAVFKDCVTGVLKPSQLLSKDVDAIMIFLRTATYGGAYEFSAKHTCADAKEHTYTADVDTWIAGSKLVDPTVINEQFTVKLPNDQVVRLRPARYESIIEILKSNQGKTEFTVEDHKRNLIHMLKSVIAQVDDVTDKEMIGQWIESPRLQSKWVSLIAEKIAELNNGWGIEPSWTAQCRDCGEEFTVHLPINPVDFFTE